MREHLFVAIGGDMYDTRVENWHDKPLRVAFKRHFNVIANVAQLKASLRAGPSTWPGGYSVAFMCDDGELLCCDCVHDNLKLVIDAVNNKYPYSQQWRVIGCDVPDLDGSEQTNCANCGRPF